MVAPLHERVAGAELDDLAEVHHRDAMGDVLHDAQIVRDEQLAQSQLLLEILQQVEELGLHGQVERAGRLVEHHEIGSHGQRARDGDALALSAAELVRVAQGHLGIEAHAGKQLVHLLVALGSRTRQAEHVDSLAHDVAHRHVGFSELYGS